VLAITSGSPVVIFTDFLYSLKISDIFFERSCSMILYHLLARLGLTQSWLVAAR